MSTGFFEFLDIEALSALELRSEPYRWGFLENALRSAEVARALRDAFPTMGYQTLRRETGTKRHNLRGRRIVDRGVFRLDGEEPVSPEWRRFAHEICSEEYREALARVGGVDLSELAVEASTWRHPEGCYIGPHPDNPGKVLTQLFYFSDGDWRFADGGCFRVLRSHDIDDCAYEIPPHIGTSIVFVRSDDSWHAYKPISAGRVRLSFQVTFCSPHMAYSDYAETT